MIKNQEKYWAPVEKGMQSFFFETYFRDIFRLLDAKEPKLNAPTSALTQAIRSGSIVYRAGKFRGEFNAKTSRELSAFATYDRSSRSWKGMAPANIAAEAAIVNTKRNEMIGEIRALLLQMETKTAQALRDAENSLYDQLPLPLDEIENDTWGDIISAVGNVGIAPEMNESIKKKLLDGYTYNQQRNIKNWTPDQVVRLRKMLEQAQIEGTARPLRDRIMEEWGVSSRKATFLARQETGLFLSEYGLARARDAGIRRYRWSASHDVRVRHRHKELDGKTISLDNPPVVDIKTGRRAHAGEDFQCRCGKIWIMDRIKTNAIGRAAGRALWLITYKYPEAV